MSTTEKAAEIRATLKTKHGWSSRQVSVRASYYSMGSSIHVEIKDPTIPLPTVKAIAEQAESIRRDGFGEILSGGNCYVSVRYSHEAQTTIGKRWIAPIQKAIDAVVPGSNSLQPIDGTEFLVGRPSEWRVTLWGDHYLSEGGNAEQLADTVGNLMVARESA